MNGLPICTKGIPSLGCALAEGHKGPHERWLLVDHEPHLWREIFGALTVPLTDNERAKLQAFADSAPLSAGELVAELVRAALAEIPNEPVWPEPATEGAQQ